MSRSKTNIRNLRLDKINRDNNFNSLFNAVIDEKSIYIKNNYSLLWLSTT